MTTFNCSADSNPPVNNYKWIDGNGTVFWTGQAYILSTPGEYNISCIATNYLYGGTNNPCYGSAEYVSGISYFIGNYFAMFTEVSEQYVHHCIV